jgi:hypothetical protein
MKEKIQPYEIVGKGIATEALIEIQSRYTTQDKAVIYYDLRDTTQTSNVRVYTTGEILTLPYKVISYQKITVTGDDRAAIGADAKFASNIVFRERTDVIKGSTSKYFVIVNKVSRIGGWFGSNPRISIDGNAYELYEKPSSLNTGLNNYRLLDSYIGDPQGKNQLTYSNGMYLTNVEVSFEKEGIPNYIVDKNSKGNEYYIKKVQPYI